MDDLFTNRLSNNSENSLEKENIMEDLKSFMSRGVESNSKK